MGITSPTVKTVWLYWKSRTFERRRVNWCSADRLLYFGGEVRAREGTLSLLCAGKEADIAYVRDVLDCIASHVHIIHGGIGAGSSVKMVHQILVGVHIMARVVQGVPSCGAMAGTMAGAYPDNFTAARIYSAGSPGNIRSMYPVYTSSYPKVQLYLGSEDTIIGSAALNTTLAAWAAVLGYDSSPDQVQSDTPVNGWTTYMLGSKLEGIWAERVGHPLPVQGAEDMKWWGFAR